MIPALILFKNQTGKYLPFHVLIRCTITISLMLPLVCLLLIHMFIHNLLSIQYDRTKSQLPAHPK